MALKNTLGDLNNHLFAQLERLGDEELSDEDLEREINRTESITKVASTIINNANLVLQAEKFRDGMFSADTKVPKMLEG